MKSFLKKALVIGAISLAPVAYAADMTGAGATFPYPAYSKWAEAYKAKTGSNLNYQSIGSSGGIKQMKAKTVDFGASDNPVKFDDLEKKVGFSSQQLLVAWYRSLTLTVLLLAKSKLMVRHWPTFFKAILRIGMTSVLPS